MRLIFAPILFFAQASVSAASWTDWRGPTSDGHASPGSGPPVDWDAASGRHILWRAGLPNSGHSSPIVIDGQVWITSATMDGSEQFVHVIDLNSGESIFEELLFRNDDPDPLGNDLNNYAAPSCAAEPGRVYVHFGSYGTACYETGTFASVWQRRDLPCMHWRGPGSSPVIFRNLLILTFDGADRQYLVALEKETGKEVWRTARSTPWDDLDSEGQAISGGDFRKAFSTPIVVHDGSRMVLVSNASKCWFGYNPVTGSELWRRFHSQGHSGSSRPLFRNGVAYLNTGYGKAQLHAIKVAGSSGEISDSAVLWVKTKNIPNRSSPLLVGERIYAVDDGGIASCSDLLTGKTIWRERLEGSYSASPVIASGHLYFTNQRGLTTVLKPSDKFEVVAENQLDLDPDSGSGASVAVVGDSMLLRVGGALFRVGEKR